MRILLATGNAYFPQTSGGSQASTHEIACMFRSNKHEVAVACDLWLWLGRIATWRYRLNMRLRRSPICHDSWNGYPVFRTTSFSENAGTICSIFKPDVVLVQAFEPVKIAHSFLSHGVPVVICIRDVEERLLGGDLLSLKSASFVSNSRFTAAWLRDRFGIDSCVIPPSINAASYKVASLGKFVTFINPVPVKGLEKACEIAGLLPQIPFRFVESWKLMKEQKKSLEIAMRTKPNISFQRRANDMKHVYGQTKLLLVPSQWNEAWGRVVSEAQVSGIPVIASNIGGLPESVGPGGILVDPKASPQEWADAIRRLWTDSEYYSELSRAALEYSYREELDTNRQATLWQKVVEDACANKKQSSLSGAPAP